jgi:hypothetical protein
MFIGDEDGKCTYHRDESRIWHPYRSSDHIDEPLRSKILTLASLRLGVRSLFPRLGVLA